MLSERIPHDEGCNSIYEPWKEPNECDCYVSEVAKLERVARAANAVIDDWPDTIYGDDDPEINHWVILHKLKVALADLPEDALK